MVERGRDSKACEKLVERKVTYGVGRLSLNYDSIVLISYRAWRTHVHVHHFCLPLFPGWSCFSNMVLKLALISTNAINHCLRSVVICQASTSIRCNIWGNLLALRCSEDPLRICMLRLQTHKLHFFLFPSSPSYARLNRNIHNIEGHSRCKTVAALVATRPLTRSGDQGGH